MLGECANALLPDGRAAASLTRSRSLRAYGAPEREVLVERVVGTISAE
jgi:hypothetical protein